jgi:hypothetical protein
LAEHSQKSREHRMRVLAHQARTAAEAAVPGPGQRDTQLQMPLIVPVKPGADARPTTKRPRRKPAARQPKLGDM